MKLGAIFLAGVVLSPLVWVFGKMIIFLIGLATLGFLIKTAVDLLEEEKTQC